jgi:hypothetical protein
MSGIAELRLVWYEMPYNQGKHTLDETVYRGPILQSRVSGGMWEDVPSVRIRTDGSEEEFSNPRQLGTIQEIRIESLSLEKGRRKG